MSVSEDCKQQTFRMYVKGRETDTSLFVGQRELDQHIFLRVLREQIDIAGNRCDTEDEFKREVIIVRCAREMGMGLKAMIDHIAKEPSLEEHIISTVVKAISKSEYMSVIKKYDYDKMMAVLHAYEHTGGINPEYRYMMRPKVATMMREIFSRVRNEPETIVFVPRAALL